MFPDKDVAVFAVITGPQNSNRVISMKAIVSMAADILLGEDPWLNTTTACSYPAPWKNKIVSEFPPNHSTSEIWRIARSPHDYVGIYTNQAFGDIVVYVETGSVLFLLFGRFGKIKLYPVTELHFEGRYVGKLWFLTDSDDNFQPITIDFSFSPDGQVEGVLFPVDSTFPKSLFLKDTENCTSGSMYITSMLMLVLMCILLIRVW